MLYFNDFDITPTEILIILIKISFEPFTIIFMYVNFKNL